MLDKMEQDPNSSHKEVKQLQCADELFRIHSELDKFDEYLESGEIVGAAVSLKDMVLYSTHILSHFTTNSSDSKRFDDRLVDLQLSRSDYVKYRTILKIVAS